jgi:hypothetical protein
MSDGSTTYEFLETPLESGPISEPASTVFQSELRSVEGDGLVPASVYTASLGFL